MRAHEFDRVKTLPLFANVGRDLFQQVVSGAHLRRFPSATLLLREGDPVDFLYVLLDGQVELHGTWNERETVLMILRPVSSFILAAVVLDADALMSARTIERSEVLMIPGEAIRKAMLEDAAFATAAARDQAGAFRGFVRTMKNQKLRSGVERLANYIITQHAAAGGRNELRLPHEKRVLASLLGMAPENLSRAFAALQNQGVEVHGATIRIRDITALTALAKPDPLIDNHAPRGGNIRADADAEIWSTVKARAALR